MLGVWQNGFQAVLKLDSAVSFAVDSSSIIFRFILIILVRLIPLLS